MELSGVLIEMIIFYFLLQQKLSEIEDLECFIVRDTDCLSVVSVMVGCV